VYALISAELPPPLPPTELHDPTLRHPGPAEAPRGRASQVVHEPIRELRALARPPPRVLQRVVADLLAVAVEHERPVPGLPPLFELFKLRPALHGACAAQTRQHGGDAIGKVV